MGQNASSEKGAKKGKSVGNIGAGAAFTQRTAQDDMETVRELCAAAARDDVSTINTILGQYPQIVNRSAGDQKSPLFAACERGCVAALMALLPHIADVHTRGPNGETPLIAAARNGHAQVCEILLDRGADRLAVNQAKQNAPAVARAAGHEELAVVLSQPRREIIDDEDGAGAEPTSAFKRAEAEAAAAAAAGAAAAGEPTPMEINTDAPPAPAMPPAPKPAATAAARTGGGMRPISDAEKVWRPITPQRFQDGKWANSTLAAAPTGVTPPRLEELSIVSYNVWFDQYAFDERFAGLCRILEELRPHVICLQEVTVRFLQLMEVVEWARRDYTVSDITGWSFPRYGVVLMWRNDVAIHNLRQVILPSRMERTLLVGDMSVNGERFTVSTAHFESLQSAGQRAKQLRIARDVLKDEQNAFILGDTNLERMEERNVARCLPDYIDCWPHLMADSADSQGFTFDSEVNKMINHVARNRLDRCFVRSVDWVSTTIRKLGDTEIQPKVWVSDHFGILVTFRRPADAPTPMAL